MNLPKLLPCQDNVYAVSNAYAEPEIMAASMMRFYRTSGSHVRKWILVDNKWPMCSSKEVDLQGLFMGAEIHRPPKNLGGHGGTSYGLSRLFFNDDDLILNYDLDSWPITQDWLVSMYNVMQSDPTLGWVAMMPNRIKDDPAWRVEHIAGYRVAFREPTEMWNVTLFRGIMLRQGMLADTKYYGFVETAMERRANSLGLRHGWMMDCIEGDHPIPHPRIYCDYKDDHARRGTYPGSFEEYIHDKT